MESTRRLAALVTGGSRGIGAATSIALAERAYDVAITYRNKAARASNVVAEITRRGAEAIAVSGDITRQQDIDQLFASVKAWRGRLDLLVLNAAGGLERDLLAADPNYPMRINRDAQLALLEAALPLMPPSGVVVFVTSHWAHLYGQIEQLPNYTPIAETKHAGEQALRAQQAMLARRGIRLIVVTGDLIEGTITPRLLERKAPGLASQQREQVGVFPTASEMGEAIAAAAANPALPSGSTIVVGRTLESLR
jgi:NAD(P)-dependent dehydrogenase (short-subunit alcohol dehydrogenase family)